MSPAAWIWIGAAVLYGAFWRWYRGPRRPLGITEIDEAVRRLEAREGPERAKILRGFLEKDDGRDFLMVNVIELRDPPGMVEGAPPAKSSREMLDRYMAYMWPQLLKRACHPIVGGKARADALDLWGIEGAEHWSQAGLMRYRSRRDLLRIVANDEFQSSHLFKRAAIAKTIAFPIAPYTAFGNIPLVVGLAVVAIAALLHLALGS